MEHKKILFEHDNAANGGFGIESAWAIQVGDNFKLDNILFYAPDYSLGDIVSAEDRNGELFVTGLVKDSGHSTVRMIFDNKDDVNEIRTYLRSIGCQSEISDLPTLISVDIPPEIDYKKIKEYLDQGSELSKWGYEEACIAHRID